MIRAGPAKSKTGSDEGDTEEDRMQRAQTFKQKKMEKLKEEAAQATMTWNTTFLRADTAVNIATERLNVSKEEFLEADENAAVRLAVAEAQTVQDMKSLLRKWGVSAKALQGASKSDESVAKLKRSKVIIIVKNIPSDVSEDELRNLFEKGARVNKILYPKVTSRDGTPIHCGFALIKFVDPQEARRAFTFAAFRKMGAARAPIYLEWAPIAENDKDDEKKKQKDNTNTNTNTDTKNKEKQTLNPEQVEQKNKLEEIKGVTTDSSCIYIKNLPFKLDDNGLKRIVIESGCADQRDILSVNIAKNGKTGKSRGFGFVQFTSPNLAKKSVDILNGYDVYGHELEAKISEHAQLTKPEATSLDIVPSGVEGNRKLMVRNIPFEAEQKQLKTLFETYGQVKNLRLPKKFDGSSRGFCFVEFTSHDEAERAMEALGPVHFLGRHLVIEWAKNESVSSDEEAPDRKREPK